MILDAETMKRALMLSATALWAMTPDGVSYLLAGPATESRSLAAAERLAPGSRAMLVDGVAVVPVYGALIRHNGAGGSYAEIRRDLAAAIGDPRVASILLAIESPGGMVVGCDECAAAVAEAARQKPVVAHIDGVGASAAYWLASQARQIFAAPTAVVGSVGAMITGHDLGGILERMGAAKIEVRSTQSPEKNPRFASDEMVAQLQPIIDDAATLFIDGIAAGRRVTPAVVENYFGKGAILSARAALARGMIDGIASFAQVLTDLSQARGADRQTQQKGPGAAAGRAVQGDERMDYSKLVAADLRANRPDLVDAIASEATADVDARVDAARKEGAARERARIKGIRAASLSNDPAEIEAAIESGATPEAFAMEQIAKAKALGVKHLNARAEAEKETPADAEPVETAAAAEDAVVDHASAEAAANAKWERMSEADKKRQVGGKDAFISLVMSDLGFPRHTRPKAA